MNQGIKLTNLSFQYPHCRPVLKNINLCIKPGAFLGITGINGSGKSTLAFCLNGLIPHQIPGKLTGQVLINHTLTTDKPVSFWAKTIGFLFQNPDFSIFNLTLKDEIAFGLKNLNIDYTDKTITQALKQVKLNYPLNRDPQTLSLGEKQKLCLASVLALNTPYIILDEPTSMLDYKTSLELYQILYKLNQQGKTIIVIDHHTDFLCRFTQQTLLLHQGTIKAFGKTNSILKQTKLIISLGIKPTTC